MSRVIRLVDLISKLGFCDTLYLNGIEFDLTLSRANTLWLHYLNPLVHIELVEEGFEEGLGSDIIDTYTYYVTIV